MRGRVLALGGLLALASAAPASVLIDFDQTGRNTSEVTETGWNAWVVTETDSASTTLGGVTFQVKRYGSAGTALGTTWYKAGVQSPNYARLVCDGLTVVDGGSGGSIQVTLSGLAAGTHTLLAYHNAVDGNAWYPVDVSVNGTRKVSSVQPTSRSLLTDTTALSYVTFTATAGKSVTVVYAPSSSGSGTRNIVINGLALDVPNAVAQAKGESPSDRDWHVDADAGTTTLSWEAGRGAAAHGLYFGTDSATVASATTASAAYQGSRTTRTWITPTLSCLKTYWWRVDETDSAGNVVPGNVWVFQPRRLAFPDAEGYGRYARGGRGGKVVHVTNLNDSGTGSLRAAVENEIGPRTIVFDVGGVITLASRLTLSSDQVTFAGQTAPGKGIVIRSCPFGMSGADDAIIRFLKVRLGYTGTTWDGTGLNGCNHTIMDHASVSWTIDEAFSSRSAKNITLQRTLISEALNIANHQNYPAGTAHGYAATIGGDVGSFHHNLLAHNEGRNWSLGGGLDGDGYYAGRLDIFNNVVYNWEGRATDGGAHEVNYVGNWYKEGPATTLHMTLRANLEGTGLGSQAYYYRGNVLQAKNNGSLTCDGTSESCGREYTLSGGQVLDWSVWSDTAFFPSYATIQSARQAYKDVLSDAGSTMPVFDDHDKRIVGEVMAGSYTYSGSVSGIPGLPDRESDVGGYESYPATSRPTGFDTDADGLPDWYEGLIGTSVASASADFSDANADAIGDGYTNLERYLEWMATPRLELAAGTTGTFDLAELFRGYTGARTWTVGTNSCLTTRINDSVLSVTPNSGCGIAFLDVTVVDATGDGKTRQVGVLATGSGTTGVAAAKPIATWTIRRELVRLEGIEGGVLELRAPDGRLLRRTVGDGDLEVSLAGLPAGIAVASYRGSDRTEHRLVQLGR